jgi:hypothetical protein
VYIAEAVPSVSAMSLVGSDRYLAYSVIRCVSPDCAGMSSVVQRCQTRFCISLHSHRHSSISIQQIDHGDVESGELHQGLEVLGSKITGDPYGDREGETLIQELEEQLHQHLFSSILELVCGMLAVNLREVSQWQERWGSRSDRKVNLSPQDSRDVH